VTPPILATFVSFPFNPVSIHRSVEVRSIEGRLQRAEITTVDCTKSMLTCFKEQQLPLGHHHESAGHQHTEYQPTCPVAHGIDSCTHQ